MEISDKEYDPLPQLPGRYAGDTLDDIYPALQKMLWYYKQRDSDDPKKLKRGFDGLSELTEDHLLILLLHCTWKAAMKILHHLLPLKELTAALKELKQEGNPKEIV